MLKTFLDYILTEWSVVSHAPAAFIVTLIVSFGLALFIINWNYKERIESLQERLKGRDEDILKLKSEIEQFQKEVEDKNSSKRRVNERTEHSIQLSQYSSADLGRETQKVARNLRVLASRVKEKQEMESGSISSQTLDMSLYNTWLSEGPKMLAIKCEVLKRLSPDLVDCLDRIPNSCYCNPIQDVNQILDMVNELHELGSQISKTPNEDSE